MTGMSPDSHLPHAIFVLLYLFVLMGVGAMKARSIKNQEDFSLAGRGLSTFVLIGTLLATWIGTGSIFGNAQKTFDVGMAGFLLPISGAFGIIALYFLAQRIRRFGQFTIQDILEARFGAATRVMGTITLVLAYVIIVSYQYRAGATVLGYIWPELGKEYATCVVAVFVIAYTALAGMYSVAYTDVANGILMTIGIVLALPILFDKVGGMEGVTSALSNSDLDTFGTYSTGQLISFLLPAFLMLIGDANMYQRFFSAKTPADAKKSAAYMLIGVLFLECAIIAVAVLGKALVAQGQLTEPENPAHIIVHMAFNTLPPLLGAMMVGTVVAIVVSTADSYLLSPATSLVRDVYQRFMRPDASEKNIVKTSRIVVLLLGLVALALAFTSDEFFGVALFAYTIYGAGITPALFAAFFWKRATGAGALSSMITGVATSILWHIAIERAVLIDWAREAGFESVASFGQQAADAGIDAVLPAVVVSIGVLIVVSLAGSPPDKEHAEAI
ncbi:MAG: SSS family solute:Na+ symporter [Planctomycetota bacterium]|jgi:SSS family solute:Na+ symporter